MTRTHFALGAGIMAAALGWSGGSYSQDGPSMVLAAIPAIQNADAPLIQSKAKQEKMVALLQRLQDEQQRLISTAVESEQLPPGEVIRRIADLEVAMGAIDYFIERQGDEKPEVRSPLTKGH